MAVQGNEKLKQERYEEIEDAFFAALDQPTAKQLNWLNTEYADDPLIIEEVKALLQAHDSEGFLETELNINADDFAPAKEQCPDLVGRKLGSYTVIRQINQGGMGRVYIAQRDDGEYNKFVAVKVVEVAGIESDLFRKERQVLANLEHPNIVTLLDGGTLPEGFPYIVMEYVDGKPIDEFVRNNQYSETQIIQLCIDLCNVVHKSHQHGVIHCDIKPANILVTPQAELKLLDFGIAQSLVNADSSDNNNFSAFALTPEYASPQRHNQMPPHVADDIYSIGLIMAQLLGRQSLPKVQRTSRFKKHFNMADTDILVDGIQNRELKSIFRKATHENTDDRYSSADAFKEDLGNWLNNRPVQALGGNLSYRSVKHVNRRWKWWVFALIAGIILYQPVRVFLDKQQEAKEQKLAEEMQLEAIRNRAAAEYEAQDMINEQRTLSRGSMALNVKEFSPYIKQAIENLERWLEEYPESNVLNRLLIQQKTLLAEYIGHPFKLSTGKLFQAQELYQEILILLHKRLAKDPENEEIQINIAEIKHELAKFQIYSGAYKLGLQAINSIRNDALVLQASSDDVKALVTRRLLIPLNLSSIHAYIQMEKYDDAKKMIKESLQSLRTVISSDGQFNTLYQALLIEQLIHIQLLTLKSAQTEDPRVIYQSMQEKALSVSILRSNPQNMQQMLLMRIENSLGCAALAAKQTEKAEQHLKAANVHAKQIMENNSGLERIHSTQQRLSAETQLSKKLSCQQPKRYLFPNQ